MQLPSSRLFRSRWSALAWAAGILWFAFKVAGSAPADHRPVPAQGNASIEVGDQPTADDVAALTNLVGS